MISVIVPVYNVEKYLEQCIQSIVTQTYSHFECILVDDGSNDGSGEICDIWQQKDNRIIVIHQKNQGVSAARNRGVAEAQGEYIAFIDSDDWVEEDYLMSLFIPMNENICDLSVVGITSDYDNGISIKSVGPIGKINVSSQNSYEFIELEKKFLLFGPYVKLYKKSIIDQYNIKFNSKFSFGEDLLFNYEYLNYVTSIYVTDRAYFTNSSHIPVWHDISIAEKAKIEGKYHNLENAGHIFYCEVDGDISKNIDAFENILHIMSDADVGYGAVNIGVVECTVCGYSWRDSSDNHICPNCGRDEREPVDE